MTDIDTLLAAADELTDPRRHVEVIEATFWDKNRNRKTRTKRRTTNVPSLLVQLAAAVVPGETYVETSPDQQSGRSGFAPRAPARLDAIDRILAIEAAAARWVLSVGLTLRETTEGNIRALAGIAATLDSDTLDALVTEVTMWRAWAATVTGWQRPPWRPRATCPICDEKGTLRVRLEQKTACCMSCGEAWAEAEIGLLADHIRAEGELTTLPRGA